MGIFVDDNGTLREIVGVFVNDNGTLRDVQKGFVNDNGTLRQFFSRGTLTLSGGSADSTASDPSNAIVRFTFNEDGTVDRTQEGSTAQVDASTDWVIPNSAAPGDYEIRFTSLSGDSPTVSGGTAENSWWAFTSGNFQLSLIQGTVGSQACSFTIEIRKGSSGAALVSGSYSLSAEVT